VGTTRLGVVGVAAAFLTLSDDVIPLFAQVHLLGRRNCTLSFRSSRFACGDALSAAFGRLLFKSRLRFFPLHTATVISCVVTPAATALRMLPRDTASTGEVRAPTSEASGCVSAVTLRVAEALAANALQQAFGSQIDSADTRKPQSSVSDHTFDTSRPRASDTRVGRQYLAWSGS